MPQVLFGGATIGAPPLTDVAAVRSMLATLRKSGIRRIDTAPSYPPTNRGECERLLGQALSTESVDEVGKFLIDAKVDVFGGRKMTEDAPVGSGSLAKEAILTSVTRTLERLRIQQVSLLIHKTCQQIHTLYCHTPDKQTPIEESLETFQELLREGRIHQYGLSNYSMDDITRIISICESRKWQKPRVVQEQYNALCRKTQTNLPTLHGSAIHLNAFSPLAGGMLSGNFSLGGDRNGTRFADDNATGKQGKLWYDKAEIHSGIRQLSESLGTQTDLSMAGASLRWLYFHSGLGDDDGMILGGTKVWQLERNLEDIQQGPLDSAALEAFNRLWETVKDVAP